MFKPFDKNSVDLLSISKDKNLLQMINLVRKNNSIFHFSHFPKNFKFLKIELVLGAFIQCENREIYIGGILSLDEQNQAVLMHLIEGILQRTHSENIASDVENNHRLLVKMDELESENMVLLKKLQEAEEEKEELYNKCVEINDILLKTQENSKNLQAANEVFFLKVCVFL